MHYRNVCYRAATKGKEKENALADLRVVEYQVRYLEEFEAARVAAETAAREATEREVRRQRRAEAIKLGTATLDAGFDSYFQLTKGQELPSESDVVAKNLLYVVRSADVCQWRNSRWETLSRTDAQAARRILASLKKVS